MSRKFRNLLFKVHLWLGLQLSIFFTFMFLTGTLLVAWVEFEAIGRPATWTTIAKEERTASFGTIYDSIKSTHPESTVFVIVKHPAPWFVGRSFGMTGGGKEVSFWTDPSTGTILHESRDPSPRNIIRGLHDSFLTGKALIQTLLCVASVLLFYQIVSGLITYRRFWKGFFRWPSRSGGLRSWSGSFHRLTAVWATPLIILIAVTSFYFMLDGMGFSNPPPKPQPPAERATALPPGFDADFIDRAEERARSAIPDFEPEVIVLPRYKFSSLDFIGHQKGSPKFRGESTVSMDPATLEILGTLTPDYRNGFARWGPLVELLHYGYWGGAFSKVLWVLLGLIATGVAFSGALIFAARRDPEGSDYGALRRIWRGMGIFRWAYVLLLLGILYASYQRFGPSTYAAAMIRPADIQMQISEPNFAAASAAINGGVPYRPV